MVEGSDGRIILKWVLGKYRCRCRRDSFGSGYRQLEGSCEYDNEPSTSIKDREFLD
jgi:hypothetical protein